MYRALKSFSGRIAMAKGQVKDIKDKTIAEDLLKIGFIEEVKEPKAKKDVEPKKAEETEEEKPKKAKKTKK